MATIVIVHGMCDGGWSWRRVGAMLRAAGHEVYTPTLTGHAVTHEIAARGKSRTCSPS